MDGHSKLPQLCLLLRLKLLLYFVHIDQSLKHVFLVFVLEATPTHTPLKYTCPSKESNE